MAAKDLSLWFTANSIQWCHA